MMTGTLNWTNDPVVVAENTIYPAVFAVTDAFWTVGQGAPCDRALAGGVEKAALLLQEGAASLLRPVGVALDDADMTRSRDAARALLAICRDLQAVVPGDPARVAALYVRFSTDVRPEVLAALNAIRRTFLVYILDRQVRQARAVTQSLDHLDRISREIFYVAINATVEAARVGEAGAGFAHIGAEIRALAQTAQAATKEYREAS